MKLRNSDVSAAGSLNLESIWRGLRRPVVGVPGTKVLAIADERYGIPSIPRDIELCGVSCCRCDGNLIVVSPLEGGEMALSFEIGRRHVEEVCLQLGFAILLPIHQALFCDESPIVIGGVTVGVAEITPVGATPCLDACQTSTNVKGVLWQLTM